ncbi:MAG: TonB-dependent receptor [Bryobacteraceae bacterium]
MKLRSLLLCLCCAAVLAAQSSTGEIAGTVTDETGAAVARARVTIRNTDTGETRQFDTGASGTYVVPQLNPGPYQITVENAGFRRFVQSGVVLQVGQRAQVDAVLSVGAVSESVEVSAQAPLVDATDASLGQVIENRKILDLPLNGRNILSLAALSTGVNPGNSFGAGLPDGRAALIQAASSNVQINGGMTQHNDVLIDGVPLSVCCQNQISFQPSIDATQEFRVRTNMFDAQYGRTGGGLILFASRGGSNEFHGSAFQFMRNRALDANNFFNNRTGAPKGHFVYNQFGARVGGPIVHNRLFFFVNYEGIRNRRGSFSSGRTPTAEERNGTFRDAIFDPLTGSTANSFTRSPFPNRTIPRSRFDPVSVNLVPLYPQANVAGANNFNSNASNSDTEDQYNFRLDYQITATHRLFGRFSLSQNDGRLPDDYGNIATPAWNQEVNNYNAVFDDTLTLSPTFTLNLRYGYSRQRNFRVAYSTGTDLTTYGWPASYNAARQAELLPEIRPAGFLGLSRATVARDAGDVHAIGGNATKFLGRHFLKFGADYRVYQRNSTNNGNAAGNFSFNTGFTRGPDALRGGGGNAFASFLLGYPAGGSLNEVGSFAATSLYQAFYLQDDIRVSDKLTVNLGLRWEVELPRDERYDRLSYFNPTIASPLAQLAGVPGLTGGLQFLGVDGESRQQNTDWNNWGPRFGFAYQLKPRTVIRGGYGITYQPIQTRYQSGSSQGFSASTSIVSSLDGGRTPAVQLRNPFPDGFNRPLGSSDGLLSSLGQSFGTLLRAEPVGYVQQFSLNIQQELSSDLLFDIAYSGSKGTRLPMPLSLNRIPSNLLSQGQALLQQVPNPFRPFVSAGALSRATITRLQSQLPYPQFGNLTANLSQLGSSTYHALQLKLNKRFSRGFSVLASYTFAKMITDTAGAGTGFLEAAPGFQDVYNRRLDRAISPEDVSSRFVISYVWELPFGKGKRFLDSAPAAAEFLLGGWQVNGITTFAAGQPIVIGNAVPTTSGASRPNNNGRSAAKSGRIQDRLNEYYDRSAFFAPDPFGFGSSPRTLPDVRSDGPQNFDLSLFKSFAIAESKSIQFRAEFFNLFNTPQFAAPGSNGRDSNFGTSQFGVIFVQRNVPRDLQLALRFNF